MGTEMGAEQSHHPAEDWQGAAVKGGIVFVGTSALALWDEMADDFAPLPVVNRAVRGSRIVDSYWAADQIIRPLEPRQVVVYSGEDDISDGHMPRDIFHDYHRLVDYIHALFPRTLVSYISIKHSPDRWPLRDAIRVTNHLIAAYTKDHPGTSFIDTASLTLDENGVPDPQYYVDGVHLAREGYLRWIPVVRAALVE